MEKYLEVKAEGKKAYDICITDSFAALAGELEQWGIKNRKLCIVTERQVASYYMDEVRGMVLIGKICWLPLAAALWEI